MKDERVEVKVDGKRRKGGIIILHPSAFILPF
jgi:hypothetical protein